MVDKFAGHAPMLWCRRLLLIVLAVALCVTVGAKTAQAAGNPYPAGAYVTSNGAPVPGFNPANGGGIGSQGRASTYSVSGRVQLHNLPAGWTVYADSGTNPITGKDTVFYVVSYGNWDYAWYFDGATGIDHTTDELRGLILTLNGQAIPDIDTTQNQTLHGLYRTDEIGYDNAPITWDCWGSVGGQNSSTYTCSPSDTGTPQVTYTFLFDAQSDQREDLTGLIAWLSDGTPVTDFDVTKEDFNIP
ncbi:hypothetical protein [Bifidobacterium parmae]|uniref:Uncharacterized protein n=1 Tax=Bifidobacterium parmae TaxID=361854 RepID=A0A2N5J0S8_9BIFI|nr:hypothetical protein [Bifidobacterium parmae]PLS27801.1 hypothetical protein Uis4E_1330 [Bifidobacterium parmae]